jgi:hypothetical protein
LKYEDMMQDYEANIARIIDYLGIEIPPSRVEEVANRYLPGQKPDPEARTHFETGKAHRFRQEFTPEEKAQLLEVYAPILEKMGYQP